MDRRRELGIALGAMFGLAISLSGCQSQEPNPAAAKAQEVAISVIKIGSSWQAATALMRRSGANPSQLAWKPPSEEEAERGVLGFVFDLPDGRSLDLLGFQGKVTQMKLLAEGGKPVDISLEEFQP